MASTKSSTEDKSAKLRREFETQPQVMALTTRDYAPWGYNLDDECQPNQFIWRKRGATGFENESILRQIFLNLELLIEEVIGAKRIHEKKLQMYKGTVKKW